jgi:hypothetical protein
VLKNYAITLCVFFILSNIPFLFGIKSLNPDTDLSSYGIEKVALKGLIYHIASASKIFVISTFMIIFNYKMFTKNILYICFWILLVSLGLYSIYASWARTAWFMFGISMIFSFLYKSSLKTKIKVTVVSLICLFFLMEFYSSNTAFRYRLTGGASYRQDTEFTIQQLSQARLPFIITAAQNLAEANPMSLVLGYGIQHGIDLFEQKTKMSIVSHNKIMEILESSGLIGLLLYIIFIFRTYRFFKKNINYISHENKKTLIGLLVLCVGFLLSSHGPTIYGEIILGIYLVSLLCESKFTSNNT